jgi:hypothetical protein
MTPTPDIIFWFCPIQFITRLLCSANDAARRLDGRDLAGHTGKFEKITNGDVPCPEPAAPSPKASDATGASLALGVTAAAATFLGLML